VELRALELRTGGEHRGLELLHVVDPFRLLRIREEPRRLRGRAELGDDGLPTAGRDRDLGDPWAIALDRDPARRRPRERLRELFDGNAAELELRHLDRGFQGPAELIEPLEER